MIVQGVTDHVRDEKKIDNIERKWIVCQVGAREHYAVARALHRTMNLEALVTDIWIPPAFLTRHLPAKLRGRFHQDLADATVVAPNLRSIASEAWPRRHSVGLGWSMVRRNQLFQERMARKLHQLNLRSDEKILFSYSYAAKHLFEFAKRRGWRTVLGQIDPGPKEERIVERLVAEADPDQRSWKKADSRYWDNWYREVELADRIIVNSEWSRISLVEEGIAAEKIDVVPLSYESMSRPESGVRQYPIRFSSQRPLRVLFLGQLNLRKGAHLVLDVCRASRNLPIEFYLVGPQQIERPIDLINNPKVHWVGPVPRSEVERYYRNADVFLFPTFSDGFGLTQLEALSWGLPVISSRSCGEVVVDGVNGRLLPVLSSETIIDVLREMLKDPKQLHEMSLRSAVTLQYSLESLATKLVKIEEKLIN